MLTKPNYITSSTQIGGFNLIPSLCRYVSLLFLTIFLYHSLIIDQANSLPISLSTSSIKTCQNCLFIPRIQPQH